MEGKTGKNKKKKIIFLIVLLVLVGLCIFSVVNFSSRYNLKEAASIGIIGGADGPTAIYVTENLNWKNILLYSLVVIIFDIIIFKIFEAIGNKRQKSLLGLSKIIIVIFNVLVIIFLFPIPRVVIILFSINFIIMMAFIIKSEWDKRKKNNA